MDLEKEMLYIKEGRLPLVKPGELAERLFNTHGELNPKGIIGFNWVCENVYGYSEQEIVLLEKKEIAKRRLKLFD
jgi:hypothetical protein